MADIGIYNNNWSDWFGPAAGTFISKANPSTETGTIETVKIACMYGNITNAKAGTFYGSGTSYTHRDSVSLGALTANVDNIITGLSIDLDVGDYIGCYGQNNGGVFKIRKTGGSGEYYAFGSDYTLDHNAHTYSLRAVYDISLLGIPEVVSVGIPQPIWWIY